ncbi:hypothetical protein OS493_019183 [Desmophyllum pertusum]|uniref:Uncharacterized protein n=1 Tax=Desmophyllum pertusum TaxID=174260 RepID=A0A9X0CEL6_9CNID|nr:hypothetical protein OS493_019183 [Desmophyllum pertusum]
MPTNADDIQLATILDFFPWAQYLPFKAYDAVLQPFIQIHDIIRKIVRQTSKSDFDSAQPVPRFDLRPASCQTCKMNARCDEGRADLLSDDYLVNTIEDMFYCARRNYKPTTLKWVIAFLSKYPIYQEDIQLAS